ncbi:MAG: DMT family transporter [Candidatus Edwardsbacteria bacterium]|jgi:drug/metabolite transporter (DMT)-like permease|nr:DMT family transporter [Candidatus Edwardsbacteria bacterium]
MSAPGRSNAPVIWVMAGAQLITGSTYLVVKLGLQEFSPFALGCIRFLISAAIFAALLVPRLGTRWFDRSDWRHFLVLAALGVPLNQGLFLYGMKYAPAAHGALLYASTPVMVLFLSCLFLGERPTWPKVAGIALGFAGVVLVLFDKGLAFARRTIGGDLLVLAAVATWAVYTIYSKKLLRRYRPLEVTGISLSLGALLFLPVGLPFMLRQDYGRVTGTGVFSVLYLAVMTSVVAYLIWAWALSRMEASKVAVISNLQPVVAAALAWIVFREAVTVRFVAGTAVVLAGVVLAERG